MRVEIKMRSLSTSKGIKKNGDIVELSAEEVQKIAAFRPMSIAILPDLEVEAPKKAAPKRMSRKKATYVKSID